MRKVLLTGLLALLLVQPALAEEHCRLIPKAFLTMIAGQNSVLVPASVDGKPLTMEVDTGGYVTSLTEKKARELGLHIEVYPGLGLSVYGGISLKHFVTFPGFTLGTMRAPTLTYPLLPDGFLPPDVDGILAPDFLANFDLDFDFANGRLNLFSRDHCDGKVVYWTKEPVSVLSIRRDDPVHISIPVQVDGREVKAMIDTGASMTIMSLDTAQNLFRIKDDDPKLEHVPGPNGIQTARHYPFQKLTFGDVQVDHPRIILVPDHDAGMGPNPPDMILGMSILRQLHMYIAYGEKKIYISSASQK